MDSTIELNVVAFREGERWVAQCLEFDIAARADSLAGLQKALERAVAANLCINTELGHEGLEGIPAAPEKFRVMFERSGLRAEPVRPRPRRADRVRFGDVRLAA